MVGKQLHRTLGFRGDVLFWDGDFAGCLRHRRILQRINLPENTNVFWIHTAWAPATDAHRQIDRVAAAIVLLDTGFVGFGLSDRNDRDS